jgi:predicted amidophosphoribosyltransferase
MIASAGETCPHCKGELPAGRQINFCPHCGQDLTVQHCPACGSELEHDWKFCVTCGRAVASG